MRFIFRLNIVSHFLYAIHLLSFISGGDYIKLVFVLVKLFDLRQFVLGGLSFASHIGGGRRQGGSTVVKAVVDKTGGECVSHLLSISRLVLLFTLMTRRYACMTMSC